MHRWRVRGAFEDYLLVDPTLVTTAEGRARAVPGPQAASLVRRAALSLPKSAKRALAEELLGPGSRRSDEDGRLLSALERALELGQLLLLREPRRRVAVPIQAGAPDAIGPESEPTGWIEIVLVDDEGNAVPDEPYKVECSDGRIRTGTTNASGKSREDGIASGSCKVSFPGLDGPSVAKA